MSEENPDMTNDPDVKLNKQIVKLLEQYASCDRRSAEINDERSTIRANAEKLGFSSGEFQDGVRYVKKMDAEGRKEHFAKVDRLIAAVDDDKQAMLWPIEAERIKKRREQDRVAAEEAAQTAKDQAERDKPGSRSDPASGGASKKKGGKGKADNVVGLDGKAVEPPPTPPEEKQETGDELIARVSKEEQAKQEQREGEAILDGMSKSQSQQAADVRAKLGL